MLRNLREQIDEIDSSILEMLNERAEIALAIGELKVKQDRSLEDEGRESELLTRLQEENGGPFADASVVNIFQTVIEETKQLEREVLADDSSDEAGSQ